MTTAREIAHRHLRCRGGDKNASGTIRYHTDLCDAITADVERALEQSFESGKSAGLDLAEMLSE